MIRGLWVAVALTASLFAVRPAWALDTGQCLPAAQVQAALKAEGQVPIVIGNRVTMRADRPVNIFTANGAGVGYELEGDAPKGTPSTTVCVVSRFHGVRVNDITSPVVPAWALIGNDRAAAEADCRARNADLCDSYGDYVRRATSGGMRVMLVARIDIANGDGTRRNGRLLTVLARPGRNIADVTLTNGSGASESGGGLEISFLKKRRGGTIVIIDDLNRLARSVRTHLAIRDAISAAGGKLESPKRIFADDPEDDILEVIEAAFAGEHRRKNAEQTLSRMRARCLGGHWCLQLPYGYVYRKDRSKGAGAIIERDEPVATIIQDALEGYASGHLTTKADVARFLQAQPQFPHHRSGRVPDQVAKNILTNPLYAGYVYVPRWDVSLRPGHHPALISFETFQKIKRRLDGSAKGLVRKDNSVDFPLRGFVACGCCGTRLTSCWAKGTGGRYPYYHCREKSCEAYGRSIPRATIEGEFADLLGAMQPSPTMFAMVHQALRTLWDQQGDRAAERKRSLTTEMRGSTTRLESPLTVSWKRRATR